MKKHSSPQGDAVILGRGEELLSALEAYAREGALQSAWLQSGLGGASGVTLSFYDLETKTYIDKTFDQPLEIVSLTGNLSMVDGEPFWHIHGVFGTRDYQTISGHVKQLPIALTSELFITPLALELTRTYDDETGLKLIQ